MQSVGDDGRKPWNQYGWFDYDLDTHAASDGFVDGYGDVTYRVGQSGSLRKDHRVKADDGSWFKPSEVLDDQIILARVIGDMASLFYPTGACNLLNTTFPGHANTFGSTIDYE